MATPKKKKRVTGETRKASTGRKPFGIGLIGTGFMGKAHANAWDSAPKFFDLPRKISLAAAAGQDVVGVLVLVDLVGPGER